MSKQCPNAANGVTLQTLFDPPASFRLACKVVVVAALLIGPSLWPADLHGQEPGGGGQLPMLVRARQGDSPASLAHRTMNDATKGWLIEAYNQRRDFLRGDAVLVPVKVFRLGGLMPDGYQTVPVLAYMGIAETGQPNGQVSPLAFQNQMNWLKSEGYRTITPEQLLKFMDFANQLPRRAVMITLDSESQTIFDVAIPVLNAVGFTATVFVAAERVGQKGAMTWRHIRQLHDMGVAIGSRGRYGRPLTRRKRGQSINAYFNWIRSDLRLAKKHIEDHLEAPCQMLAYPHGKTNGLVRAMAAKIGFSGACVQSPGDNPFFVDRFAIHRMVIDNQVDWTQFGRQLVTRIKADLN